MTRDEGRSLVAQLRVVSGGTIELVSPIVGYFREAPARDVILGPGARAGVIEVLGAACTVLVPDGAVGRVLEGPHLSRRPVSYGDTLLRLDPTALTGPARAHAVAAEAQAVENVFCAPMAGRFYARPSPGKPPFVEVGQEVEAGRTVALLEIMKTFNRLPYGGAGVPSRCRVVELLVADGDDVAAGQPLFRYEPA